MAVLVLFSGAPQVKPGQTYYAQPYGFEFGIGESKLFDTALAENYGRPADNDGADFAELFCAAENIHLDRYNNADPKPFSVQPYGEPPPIEDAPPAEEPPIDEPTQSFTADAVTEV